MWKRWLQRILAFSLSAIFLYLAFRGVHFDQFIQEVFDLNFSMVALAVLFATFAFLVKARRWSVLIRSLKPSVEYRNVLSAVSIGALVDQVLPARAGELVRVFAISRKEGLRKMSVFGSLILERGTDLSIILIITLTPVFFLTLENKYIYKAQQAGFILLVLILIVSLIFLRFRLFFESVIQNLLPEKISSKATDLSYSLSEGFKTINSAWTGLSLIFWSGLMWLFTLLSFYPLLYSINFDTNVPVYTVFILLLFLILGLALPAAPGSIGVFEYAAVFTLQIILPDEIMAKSETIAKASVFGVLLHITQVLPEIVLGGIFFLREGMNLPLNHNMQDDV